MAVCFKNILAEISFSIQDSHQRFWLERFQYKIALKYYDCAKNALRKFYKMRDESQSVMWWPQSFWNTLNNQGSLYSFSFYRILYTLPMGRDAGSIIIISVSEYPKLIKELLLIIIPVSTGSQGYLRTKMCMEKCRGFFFFFPLQKHKIDGKLVFCSKDALAAYSSPSITVWHVFPMP